MGERESGAWFFLVERESVSPSPPLYTINLPFLFFTERECVRVRVRVRCASQPKPETFLCLCVMWMGRDSCVWEGVCVRVLKNIGVFGTDLVLCASLRARVACVC